ncbi:hypothetical protein BURPS1710b_1006 [Burkholderia pseudomallei 1710b]|uniref:Uncharacterized protein n=1 Tax=Burkholderia pseudomallei (strain 1710b) TaxID=320372 RepID=Q3JVI4_BURP1|nr:hypothetical protein BURPS1710b_1006 [Burkholderia pseudomallei 1710b]
MDRVGEHVRLVRVRDRVHLRRAEQRRAERGRVRDPRLRRGGDHRLQVARGARVRHREAVALVVRGDAVLPRECVDQHGLRGIDVQRLQRRDERAVEDRRQLRERGLLARRRRERRAADVRHVRYEHVRRARRDDLLDDARELLRGEADLLRGGELRGGRIALSLRDLHLIEDVVRAAVDEHDLIRVEAAVLLQVLLHLRRDGHGRRLRVVGVRDARVRVADARLLRDARAALRVAQAARRLQRHAEAAFERRGERAAVVGGDVLRPYLARIRREAPAAEADQDLRRIRADVRQAVAEGHDLHVHAGARLRRAVVVAAAAGGEQRERGARERDLRAAPEAAARGAGGLLLSLQRIHAGLSS